MEQTMKGPISEESQKGITEIPQGDLYIGSKLIRAFPQEKNGKEGYSVRYPDGYLIWSPKDTFETAYRLVTKEEKILSR